jgi:putative N-acetyltransferase (TIGR04045 family)
VIFKVVGCREELDQYFAVRHSVFVAEQGIFAESDGDEHDRGAIHIIAKDPVTGEVVGAVRCYPQGDGPWFGGRLAVRKGYRHNGTARGLVHKAVDLMRERCCPRFLAQVQVSNVHFFLELGWRSVGTPVIYCGLPHQLMEADLKADGGRPQDG